MYSSLGAVRTGPHSRRNVTEVTYATRLLPYALDIPLIDAESPPNSAEPMVAIKADMRMTISLFNICEDGPLLRSMWGERRAHVHAAGEERGDRKTCG